jgi:uncharacterized protein (DUF1330 family)
MPAYIIGEIEITDPETYKRYTARTPDVIAKHGGRFVVRGGNGEALEGASPRRVVVIEFPDRATAKRFYESPDYQEILKIRLSASNGRLFLVDGVDSPTPPAGL